MRLPEISFCSVLRTALSGGLSLVVTFSLFAAGTPDKESYKLKFVPKSAGPITIDGKIDEEAWKGAALIDDWGELASRRIPGGCFMPKTEARLLWDDRYLYVAMTCAEDTPENMAAFRSLVEDRSCSIFFRDCVEMHVNGKGEAGLPKVQVWLNATDEIVAQRYFDDGYGPTTDNDYGKAMDWQKAYYIGEDFWQVEARFALADLDSSAKIGSRLSFNLGRFRLNKRFISNKDGSSAKLPRDFQIMCWTAREISQSNVQFGRIILVDKEPASILDGLKLSYTDLNDHEILVQTEKSYLVIKDGKVGEKTYLDAARELAVSAKPALDKFLALKDEIAEPEKGFWANRMASIAAQTNAMAEAVAKYAGDVETTPGDINDLEKKAPGWRKKFDDAYWLALRDLIRIEGKARHPVELKYVEDNPAPQSVLETCWFKPWERHFNGVAWAKPLFERKPRVLVHVYKGDTYAAWGLANRMDIDMDVWDSNDFDGRYRGSLVSSGDYGITEAQKIQQLENLLAKNKYDAFIFIGVSPELWPARLQCALAERMIGGAKAVVINGRTWDLNCKADKEFSKGFPTAISALTYPIGFNFNTYYKLDYRPFEYKFPLISSAPYGKGTYTVFNPGKSFNFLTYNAFTPGFLNYPCDMFQDEYVRAANVRAVMEGLGLRGNSTLSEVVETKCTIGKPFDVTVKGNGVAGFKAQLNTVVRDSMGKVAAEVAQPVEFSEGVSEFKVNLPALDFGRYGVTSTLTLDNGGVLDFVTGYAYVKDDGAKIDSLNIAKKCFEPGETITAELSVANPVEGLAVEAYVRDPQLRTMIKGIFPVDASTGKAKISFSDKRLTRNCHFIVVSLVKDGVVMDRTEKEFYRHIGAETDFEVFSDSSHGSTEDFLMRQSMLEWFGMDLMQSGAPTRHFWGGSPVIRECVSGKFNRWRGTIGAKWHAKRLADLYSAHAQTLKEHNGRYISIGDDSSPAYYFAKDVPDWVTPLIDRVGCKKGRRILSIHIRDVAVDFVKNKLEEDEIGDLKEALAEAYGDDVFWFNAQNGMRLNSMDEITVAKMREVNPPESSEFGNFMKFVRDRYGNDISKLNAAWHTELKSFYDVTEKVLDDAKFAGHYRPTLDKYAFFEYLADYEFGAIADAVHAVDPSIGVGMGASMYMNLLPQCMKHLDTHCPYYAEEIDNGRMLKARFLGHTAGCYYPWNAMPNLSTYTIWHSAMGGANFGWFWMSFIGFRGDHAIHPGYIGWQLKAYRELSRGPASLMIRSKRENDGVRILYSTPSAYITTMRQEDGIHPASRDTFSRMVEELGFQFDYILDESVAAGELAADGDRLLILPCAKIISEGAAKKIREFVENGGILIADVKPAVFSEDGDDLPVGRLDGIFDIADGKMDKTGAQFTVKQVGKGTAIYLGVNPIKWKLLAKNGEEAAAKKDIVDALAKCGITSRCATTTADGAPVAAVEYTRFTRNGITCLGIEKKPVAREKYPLAATVKLDKPAYVYDIRAGKALGRLESIPVTFEGFDTMFFALLDADVGKMEIKAPAKVARGGELTVTAKLNSTATHLFRFDLVPKGGYTFEKMMPIRPQFIDAENGTATATFAIAFDEADGYTLEVTDIVTGATASQPIVFE